MDSNTLWCNFGQKGAQSLGAQSCPSGGSCAVKYLKKVFMNYFYSFYLINILYPYFRLQLKQHQG